MGSTSKKYKEKESSSRKRRSHHSPTTTTNTQQQDEHQEAAQQQQQRKHRHKKHHHRDRRREKQPRLDHGDDTDGSDVVEVIVDQPPAPQQKHHHHTTEAATSSESLSVSETNKLRAKLGLKPLEGAATTKDDGKKKDDLGEFYHKPAENWTQKTAREKIRNKIALHKEKRQLHAKLIKSTKLLAADDDNSGDDVEDWVSKSRRLDQAKKDADKRARMLEELDAQFGVNEIIESEKKSLRNKQYTERNLKGLKVEHAADSFADERTVILTLKDQGVLDDGDDVLVNVNMLDNERYQKSNENKKRKIVYNAYGVEEFDEHGNPIDKSLLAQYDEEIDGVKKDGFQIGYDNTIENRQQLALTIKEKLARKRLETIDHVDLKLASDYYNEQELEKFKKPKKKIRKIRTKGKLLTADDLEQQQQQIHNNSNKGIEAVGSRRPNKYKQDQIDYDIDDVPLITNEIKFNVDYNDEEDKDSILEKALHKARQMKQRENLQQLLLVKPESESEQNNDNDNGLNITLNSTAEFCRTLGDIPTYGKSGNRDETEDIIDYDKDQMIKNEYNHNDDDDDEMDGNNSEEKTGWNSIDPNQLLNNNQNTILPHDVQILDEEPDVSTGMGAALKLAMSKGYLDKEESNRPSNSRLAHLQAKHYSIEDKTYGDETDRNNSNNRRERYAGPITDFREKDGFKPNVKLEYIDDDGHLLNSKEAFRYLSHKFHGKGPGKNKVEKRLKKSIQEQLMKKMSSTDTPLGTLNMLQAKQKETQSAFVVLSGSKHQSTVISKSSSTSTRR